MVADVTSNQRSEIMLVLEQIRCPKCNRRLVDLQGQAQIKCSKCKTLLNIDTEKRKIQIITERQK